MESGGGERTGLKIKIHHSQNRGGTVKQKENEKKEGERRKNEKKQKKGKR